MGNAISTHQKNKNRLREKKQQREIIDNSNNNNAMLLNSSSSPRVVQAIVEHENKNNDASCFAAVLRTLAKQRSASSSRALAKEQHEEPQIVAAKQEEEEDEITVEYIVPPSPDQKESDRRKSNYDMLALSYSNSQENPNHNVNAMMLQMLEDVSSKSEDSGGNIVVVQYADPTSTLNSEKEEQHDGEFMEAKRISSIRALEPDEAQNEKAIHKKIKKKTKRIKKSNADDEAGTTKSEVKRETVIVVEDKSNEEEDLTSEMVEEDENKIKAVIYEQFIRVPDFNNNFINLVTIPGVDMGYIVDYIEKHHANCKVFLIDNLDVVDASAAMMEHNTPPFLVALEGCGVTVEEIMLYRNRYSQVIFESQGHSEVLNSHWDEKHPLFDNIWLYKMSPHSANHFS